MKWNFQFDVVVKNKAARHSVTHQYETITSDLIAMFTKFTNKIVTNCTKHLKHI